MAYKLISIQQFHTFQLQANADRIVDLSTVDDLKALKGKRNGVDFVLIGQGSNCVFLEDFHGDIVVPRIFGKDFKETLNDYVVEVYASEAWHQFVSWLLDNGIYGLENLALIPGTVGAAPIQNIGAYGVEVERFIETVYYYDLDAGYEVALNREACKFGYRDSIFKHELKGNALITKVVFRIPKTWQPVCNYAGLAELNRPTAKQIFDRVIEIRQAKLPNPVELGNAGSFFKNPIIPNQQLENLLASNPDLPCYPAIEGYTKIAAGWLIDQCQLKGFNINDIAVHDKQALVLVNRTNNGLGTDLVRLVKHIQEVVYQKFGVKLQPEVRCFGHHGEIVESSEWERILA